MFDVLIVGAGPAGSIAAIVLARAGARVCLIDRAVFPRPKLCGDTLNPAAVAILARLGLRHVVERDVTLLEGMRVTGDGVSISAAYPGSLHGVAVARERLDAALVAAAAEEGADVREQLTARTPRLREEPGRTVVHGAICTAGAGTRVELAARVTIAADGRRSTLAFALGLARHPASPRRWAIGGHAVGVEGLSSYGEMHIRRGHYIGVAPLDGGIANVCLVRRFESPSHDALRNPGDTLLTAAQGDPLLRERFAGATLISKPMVLGPLAVDPVDGAVVPSGLLLAGDAAGFIDPMTGDGLRFALRGGELAAHAALRALEHGWRGVHAWHDRERTREFGPKWRFNRMLRGLVGSSLGVRGAAIGGRVAPGMVRALIRCASDCGAARTA
jgi:flavin-dependent dehydrogenase